MLLKLRVPFGKNAPREINLLYGLYEQTGGVKMNLWACTNTSVNP